MQNKNAVRPGVVDRHQLTKCTWYCCNGCKVFSTDEYTAEDPPGCAACGRPMSTDPSSYADAHQSFEEQGIVEF